MSKFTQAAELFLKELGAPVTPGMVNAVTAWTMQESGGAITGNNPWNLHSPALGQSGSRYAGPGDTAVAVFPSLQAGVHAAVTDLIAHGHDWAHYDSVIATARAGDPLAFLDALSRSAWSAGRYGGPDHNRLVAIYNTLGAPVAVPKVPTLSAEPVSYTGLFGSLIFALGQIAQGGIVTSTPTNGITPPEAIVLNAVVALLPYLASLFPRALSTPNVSVANAVAAAVAAVPVASSASSKPAGASPVTVNIISSSPLLSGTEGTIPAGTRRWALDGTELGTIGPSTLAFASEDFLSGHLNGHFLRTTTQPPVYVIAAEVSLNTQAAAPAPYVPGPDPITNIAQTKDASPEGSLTGPEYSVLIRGASTPIDFVAQCKAWDAANLGTSTYLEQLYVRLNIYCNAWRTGRSIVAPAIQAVQAEIFRAEQISNGTGVGSVDRSIPFDVLVRGEGDFVDGPAELQSILLSAGA